MKEKDVLYFEEDDASQTGLNGKQVFITKRINGETAHNKKTDKKKEKSLNNQKEEPLADNEILIDIDNFFIPDKSENNRNRANTQKTNNRGTNNKKTDKQQNSKKTNGKKRNNKKAGSKKGKSRELVQEQAEEIEDIRENRPKRKKKKKIGARVIKILVLLLIIAGTVVFAMVSPTFNIQEIVVQGNDTVDTETIISLSGLQIGKNIFQNLKSDIIENIKENNYIEDVEIKRSLPDTIEITVEERSIAYQVQVINSYVYIDYKGYILETSSTDAGVPVISGFSTSQDELINGQRVVSDDITKLNVIYKIAESAKQKNIYDLITEIIVEDNEYTLYLKSEKKYVYLGEGTNITNKMSYVQTILENEKGNSGRIFVNGDLDDGFKPYFREESV